MKAYQVTAHSGLEAVKLLDFPDPQPGPNEVLVKVRANSINYRDLAMPLGGYPRNKKVPLIPFSDAAGDVLAVGQEVTRFSEGDKVVSCFFTDWIGGELDESAAGTALGGGVDGVLAEYICLPQRALLPMPRHLDFQEAACLPCAAVTAWQALIRGNLRAGHDILLLGTGGVSLFALQLAKAFGARVIITSSSDQKLARAQEMGADELINYKEIPDWHKKVKELTNGQGVHNVVEVGGVGTLERSLASTRMSGTVCLIGVLSGVKERPSPLWALYNCITIRGIMVGSRRMFSELIAALELHQLRPVIDTVIPFSEAIGAYELLPQGKHFGKIVISYP